MRTGLVRYKILSRDLGVTADLDDNSKIISPA